MRKKMISLVMSIVLAVSLILISETDQVYAISQNDVVSQLNSLISQYNGKTANSNQMYMGSQCKGFANWIFLKIFGVYIGPYPESANYKISNPNAQTVGILEPGNLNEDSAKALLQKGVPGDYIQVQRSTARGRGPHSMILTGVNDSGIEVFDCNSDGRNTIKKYTISWSAFDTANRAMSLYHAHSYSADSFEPSNPPTPQGTLLNLGDSFSARIRNCSSGKLLTNWDNSNVYLDSEKSEYYAKQIWKFRRNSSGSYKIISSTADVAMDLDCAKDEDGANVKLHVNYETEAQNWYIYQRSDGTLFFQSAVSQNRVFDIEYGSTDDGTNVQLYTSNDSDAQKFYIDKCNDVGNIGDDFNALILNKDCWKPIMVGDANRVFLSTETEKNHPRQLWHFTYNSSDGSYFIQSYYNDCYLDVAGGGDCDGTPIGVWKENKDLPQRWFVIQDGDGYKLKSACATRIMDVLLGSTEDGTPIQLWTSNESAAQIFTIYKINGERDKISYHLLSDSTIIGCGEKAKITVADAWYAIDYKLHIVKPNGKTDTINLGVENEYEFSAKEEGTYKIYASVKSPVSEYTGSINDNCITITVKDGNETPKGHEISNPAISIQKNKYNPSEEIKISASADGDVEYYTAVIYDSKGIEVVRNKFTGHEFVISASKLKQGTYTAKVICSNSTSNVETKKVAFEVSCSHNYTASVTKKPSCIQTGVKTYQCACGASYTEKIKATGHTWDDGKITKEPTEKEEGTCTYTCRNCGEIRMEQIPETGQKDDNLDEDDMDQESGDDLDEEDQDSDDNMGGEEQEILEVGDLVEDIYSDAMYEVISVSETNVCVEYVESADDKAKIINIPANITTEDDVICKVTSISKGAFEKNKRIKKVVIGSNVKMIGKRAFYGCKNLSTVTLGKNVVLIGEGAFSSCKKLAKLTITSKVTQIGSNAFYGCKGLKKLQIKTSKLTAKKLGKKAFRGLPTKTILQVPKSKLKTYKMIFRQRGLSRRNKVKS